MFRHIRYSKYAEPSLSGMTLRPSPERVIMRYASVGLTAFLVTLLAFSIFTPVETTDAAELLFANQATGGSVSLTTSGNVNLSMETSATGTVRTAVDAVRVTAGSAGYQLYLSVAGDNNALVRDGGSSNNESDTIPAGGGNSIASPTALDVNTWGFAVASRNTTSGSGSEDVLANGFDSSYPTGDSSVATSKFAKVPAKGSDVKIASRSSIASNVLTNVYYGINASTAKPSGLYKNTITYTAIGDGSVAGLASVTPARTNQLGGGQTLTISTSSTTALNSVGTVTVTVGGATCTNPNVEKSDNGTGSLNNVTCTSPTLATGWHEVIVNFEGSGETYVVNPGIEYYLEEGGSQVAVYMQDFTVTDCANMASLSSITLQDNRDNNIYRITKQADGNCWMTENLRLGTTPDGKSIQSVTLNSSNSDIPKGESSYTINASDIQTSGTDSWGYDETHVFSFANTENAKEYGNLYNWYTATASSGTQNGVTGGADATSSICPKGWKLPPNTGNGSYTNLMQAQIPNIPTSDTNTTYINAFQQTPLNFALSGYYRSSTVYQGVEGGYWSRTSSSSNNKYAIYFYFSTTSGYFHLQGYDYKYVGRSVRCVFTPTMQDFSAVACTNLNTAQTVTLTDARDQNEYSVTKQADGNCWMTQNLRLGTTRDGTGVQNVTLTTKNSDLPAGSADYTISTSDILKTGDTYTDWSTNYDATHVFSFANTANATTYGNLYNWYTATASSGTLNGVIDGADATSSICPKNWKLPPWAETYSYSNLIQAQFPGIPTNGTIPTYVNQFKQAPLSFVFAGWYDNNGLGGQNHSSGNWSRTSRPNDNHDAYLFYFNTDSDFNLYFITKKFYGEAVRCIFVP